MNAACRVEAQHRRKLTLPDFPRKLAAMPDVVAVNRREQLDGDGEAKPEPRQPVALNLTANQEIAG